MIDDYPQSSRRAFLKGAAVTLVALAFPKQAQGEMQTNGAAAKDDLSAYPFTKMTRSNWPAPKEDETKILGIRLTEAEARALMEYKVNHAVLKNKKTLRNLSERHGINTGFIAITAAKNLVMPSFYKNAVKEISSDTPWNSFPGKDMTVENVINAFWLHMSDHVQKDDVEAQCRTSQGKELGMILGSSYPLYLQVLGPAEQWRGTVPFDPKTLNFHNDAALENVSRRRPLLDFVKIVRDLELPEELLSVTPDDLRAALGSAIEERLKAALGTSSWTGRAARQSSPGTQAISFK